MTEKNIPTPITLPDFDELIRLAQTDPEQLSQLRQAVAQQYIAQRSDEWQQRLEALQSHIERLISTGRNPYHVNMLLHQAMQDSVASLRQACVCPLQGGTVLTFPSERVRS